MNSIAPKPAFVELITPPPATMEEFVIEFATMRVLVAIEPVHLRKGSPDWCSFAARS